MHVREKMEHLNDWWTADMEAFVSSGYTSADFALMTMQSKLLFRRGVHELFNECSTLGVDMIVVSGGIHELIDISLKILRDYHHQKAEGDFLEPVKIISN